MIDSELCIPTRLVFGRGRYREIGKFVKGFSDKVLLLYGGGSIKKTGVYEGVTDSLREQGITWTELSGITSNPTLEIVQKGIKICREKSIGMLLAVGGGSVIDTAKAIACGRLYDGDVRDFFCGRKEVAKALPIAVVLTIPGTGSEVSGNAVLTNTINHEKRSAISDLLRPRLSILDPSLCTTTPKNQIGNGVYDMLSHTMERYFSPTLHTDVTDGVAEGVMKAILKNGPVVYENPHDLDAWGELMLAADFSHNGITGFSREGDWTNHNIEEIISGYYNIPHGAGLAVITPGWMRYVYRKHLPMFVQFAVNVMGVGGAIRDQKETALEGIRALERFSKRLGLPQRLSELGVDGSRLEEMARICTGWQPDGKVGKLERLSWEDVYSIYQSVL